jgi:hypothetical protein
MKDTVRIPKEIICSTLFLFGQNLVQAMYKKLGKFMTVDSEDTTLHCLLSTFAARCG